MLAAAGIAESANVLHADPLTHPGILPQGAEQGLCWGMLDSAGDLARFAGDTLFDDSENRFAHLDTSTGKRALSFHVPLPARTAPACTAMKSRPLDLSAAARGERA
jgi:hypothetical protein